MMICNFCSSIARYMNPPAPVELTDEQIQVFVQGKRAQKTVTRWELNFEAERLDVLDLDRLSQTIDQEFIADESLMGLNLSRSHLNDDQLERMARAGCFNHVSILILADNPQLTARGIACLATCENLQELDLSENANIIRVDLNEWIETEGFIHLKSLILSNTGIRESDLNQIIQKAAWIRSLEGINLSDNESLERFPKSISQLIGLKSHGISRCIVTSGGPIHWQGRGIWLYRCPQLKITKELIDLAIEDKIWGYVSEGPSPQWASSMFNSRNLSREQIYELYKISESAN